VLTCNGPQDYPTIVFNPKESVEMPFRYIADGDEPRLPQGMRELLHEDLNKSFDFYPTSGYGGTKDIKAAGQGRKGRSLMNVFFFGMPGSLFHRLYPHAPCKMDSPVPEKPVRHEFSGDLASNINEV